MRKQRLSLTGLRRTQRLSRCVSDPDVHIANFPCVFALLQTPRGGQLTVRTFLTTRLLPRSFEAQSSLEGPLSI